MDNTSHEHVIGIYWIHVKLKQPNVNSLSCFFYQVDIGFNFKNASSKTWFAGKHGHHLLINPIYRHYVQITYTICGRMDQDNNETAIS